MIKKLLYILLFLFCSYSYGQAIQMTTTSITDRWSPFNVVKSGMNLTWTVTNPLIGTITINENQPIFDFSANNGSDILITITSADGFNGLTVFDLRDRFNGVSVNGIPSQMFVKQIDLSVATNLVELSTQYNRLPSLYIGENQKIEKLNIRGSRQLTNGIDISNNPLLTQIIADVTALTTLDIRNNPLLTDLRLYNARLTSVALDKILIDLDRHGLSNGNLQIAGQTTDQSITPAAFDAYNSLIVKGWKIDVDPPLSPTASKTSLSKISIYPNPITSDVDEVSFKTMVSGTADVTLYNSNGQIIGTLFNGETIEGQNNIIQYDLNVLEQGMYFAVFKIGNEIIRKKILITK